MNPSRSGLSFLRQQRFISYIMCARELSHFSHVLSLCEPMDCSPLGSSVHGILQAWILKWVAMPSSRGFSQPCDGTCVSCLLHWQVGSVQLMPTGKPSLPHCEMVGFSGIDSVPHSHLGTKSFHLKAPPSTLGPSRQEKRAKVVSRRFSWPRTGNGTHYFCICSVFFFLKRESEHFFLTLCLARRRGYGCW